MLPLLPQGCLLQPDHYLLLSLLVSCCRPPECKALLGSVLAQGSRDASLDIRDRALLYYRLLQSGIERAQAVIQGSTDGMVAGSFSDLLTTEIRDQVFREFNSLAVVYREPSAAFVDEDNIVARREQPASPWPRPLCSDVTQGRAI